MTQNYKRIAKNTLFLYFRMIIIMGVSLYTTRIVLSTLGVTDYGIYSVVASFVLMFEFLNSALTSSTQRFITFELGKFGKQDVQKVFSISMIIHIGLALLVGVLAEIIGCWFLNNKLNIPTNRMDAAFWVFHFALLSTMINIIKVPYHAMVIAHERMSFFAYMSILEAVLKLLAVYLLVIITFDKLVAYAGFTTFVVFMLLGFYYFYNKNHYKVESTFSIKWDKNLAKEMFFFSGWSLFGGIAWMLMNHGINIMLNIFFGPAVNAARGISIQVNSAISSLINSFRIAVNPQIIKMYSGDNSDGMKHLSLLSARYTFYLALILILPLYLEIDAILNFWLVDVPDWAVDFSELTLIFTLIQTFSLSFGVVFQSIGKIQENQIYSSLVFLSVLPLSYFLIKVHDMAPLSVYYVQIVCTVFISFAIKPYLLKKIASISYKNYFTNFILPVGKVVVCLSIFQYFLALVETNILTKIINTILGLIVIVFLLDFDKKTKKIIYNKLKGFK
jgi:O-antigen/teichoic acid export membrane protein